MSPGTYPATLLLRLLGTAQQTRPSGGNKTGLLTLDGVSGDGRRLTNVLVVTLFDIVSLLLSLGWLRLLLTPP